MTNMKTIMKENDITGNKITVIMLILIDFDNNNINKDNDNSSNKVMVWY